MFKIVAKIRGFIFDLDGVITETAEFHFQSWRKLAEEEGISFSRADNEKLRGLTRRQSLEIFLDRQEKSEKEKQELADRKNNYYQEFVNRITAENLLPGVKVLLDKLQVNNYKIAVASSSRNARPVIKNLGIKDIFITISDGYSVKNPKPAPDIFLLTAKKMKLKPEECVVIEDSESGIRAANTANMVTIGIGPETRVGKADYRYDTITDIKLSDII